MKKVYVVLWMAVCMISGFSPEEAAAAMKQEPLPSETEGAASEPKISFHGYGELHYNHPMIEGTGFPEGDLLPTLDFHRLVLGWSWYYTDRLSLHAEIDYEHAAKELELEFAYVDYLINDAVNLRVGAVLIPVGPLNEFHEPTLFYSVERPYVQRSIIPTTWNSGGFGFFGQLSEGLSYRLYLVEGLDASGFSEDGIRGGRQALFEDTNHAVNFGGVGRLEYAGLPGFVAGASLYSAGAGQGTPGLGKAHVTLWEADLRYRFRGIDLNGLYAQSRIRAADRISAAAGATVGSEQVGWYAEAAYHLASLLGTERDFVPFIRYEQIDTQSKVPSGFAENPETDRNVTTYGLAFYPHPDVALKADREMWKNESGADAARFNLALAFMY